MENKRLIDMDVRELDAYLDRREERLLSAIREEIRASRVPETVTGLDGIASIFNCSRSTAARIKKSGVIDDAIFQTGRTITCDVRKALKLKPN